MLVLSAVIEKLLIRSDTAWRVRNQVFTPRLSQLARRHALELAGGPSMSGSGRVMMVGRDA